MNLDLLVGWYNKSMLLVFVLNKQCDIIIFKGILVGYDHAGVYLCVV